MRAPGTASVIVRTYSGKEAETILAQAKAYKRIVVRILNGNADRDPAAFLADVKHIAQQAAEEGA